MLQVRLDDQTGEWQVLNERGRPVYVTLDEDDAREASVTLESALPEWNPEDGGGFFDPTALEDDLDHWPEFGNDDWPNW